MQSSAQRRYSLLQTMGTRLWVPRLQLPGAAASKTCDWPLPQQPARTSSREQLLQQLNQPAPQASQLASLPLTSTRTEAPAPVPAVQATPSATLAAPVISLQTLNAEVWLLANGWQLILPQAAPSALHLSLLQNLLNALAGQQLGRLAQHAFQWPLPGVPVEHGDLAEMRQSLCSFLTGAAFREVRIPGLLVMGQALFDLLQPAAAELPPLYALPLLDELLASGAVKQHCWQQAGESGLRIHFAASPLLL